MKIAAAAVDSFWKQAEQPTSKKHRSLEAYRQFLLGKCQLSPDHGFSVDPKEVHPLLKPHQRASVVWAVKGGRRALFESFGNYIHEYSCI